MSPTNGVTLLSVNVTLISYLISNGVANGVGVGVGVVIVISDGTVIFIYSTLAVPVIQYIAIYDPVFVLGIIISLFNVKFSI